MTIRIPRAFPWRPIGWTAAAALLLIPAIAMQFTAEVQWTASDFVVMGALIGGIGIVFEFLGRQSKSGAYRIATALMLLGVFLTIWVNMAVGVIGGSDDPRNLMFAGVLAAIAGGSIGSSFQAAGMKRTLVLAAVGQILVGAAALTGSAVASEGPAWPRVMIGFTALLSFLWLGAAMLYRKASQD